MSGEQDPVVGDESFERYARMVRRTLGVPTALVSIVEAERQVFPGAVGLPDPWQVRRETPLTHSFCQYVVADRAPLVIEDARLDPRLSANLAIRDLGVVAYAGFPLTDARGEVVGSLCAIDATPRRWTERELADLADLAESCSAELALREQSRRADESERQTRQANRQALTLLALSEGLSATRTVGEVAAAVRAAAGTALGCRHAGIWLLENSGRRLAFVPDEGTSWLQAARHDHTAVDSTNPLGEVAATGRPSFFRDRADLRERYPIVGDDAGDAAEGAALMPLTLAGAPLGVLALQWDAPREFSETDRVTIAALTAYTAQAVSRARLLGDRMNAARTLQESLLTALPTHPDLSFAARYRPAGADEQVGGDWYDALVLPDGRVSVAVGDVIGHDVAAAAVMGQLRGVLRTLVWDRADAPSATITRMDAAIRDLGLRTFATLLLAAVEVASGGGAARLRFSNAGAPPLLVVRASGEVERIDNGVYDVQLGVDLGADRHDHEVHLRAGDVAVLYTDGLIESRAADLFAGLDRLAAALAHRFTQHRSGDLGDLLDAILHDLLDARPEDDVAILAVCVSGGS